MDKVLLQIQFENVRTRALQEIFDKLGISGKRIKMVRKIVKMSWKSTKLICVYKILFQDDDTMRKYVHELYNSNLRMHLINCQIFDGTLASYDSWSSEDAVIRRCHL
jgi:hypothetical protein